jgi:dolichyl-phosphate beta-glucosyltransferase
MNLSIVVPAYNEEKRIRKSLDKIFDFLDSKQISYEVIVVDDGSKDKTVEIINSLKNSKLRLLRNKKNSGKGQTVKNGMLEAKGNVVVFTDADLSTPIEEVDKALDWLEKGYDIIIGSRGLKNSDIKIKQPLYRRMMGRIFNIITQILSVRGIKDTQCGFKCFKKETVKKIFQKQTLTGFSFDVEILFLAQKYKYKIKEMPVQWLNDAESKVSPIKDSLRMFRDIFKIQINNMSGKY